MQTLKIDKFLNRLREIPESRFCVGNVYDFLRENPVCKDSLSPFTFFSRNSYTRNLIFKNELFEMMAVCWDVGQASLVHDHAEQSCWMTMPVGKLRIKNFRVVEQDLSRNYCRLEETETFDLKPDCSAEVQLEEPLHQVFNPSEFNARAISVHIYSRPFERCNVFSLQKNEVRERQMCYTSMYGKLLPDARL
jgi:cysteine dioxygenase